MTRLTFLGTLPAFAAELAELLRNQGRDDLALQIAALPIEDRCRCGEAYCSTFYTAPEPNRAYGAGHANLHVASLEGMIILDLVDDEIRCIEVLDRPDVQAALFAALP